MILECKALLEHAYYLSKEPELQDAAKVPHGAQYSLAIGRLTKRTVLKLKSELFITLSKLNIDELPDTLTGFISFRVSNSEKLTSTFDSQEVGIKHVSVNIKTKNLEPLDLFFVRHETVDIIEQSDRIDLNKNLYLHVVLKVISEVPVILTLEKDISRLTLTTTDADELNDKRKVP